MRRLSQRKIFKTIIMAVFLLLIGLTIIAFMKFFDYIGIPLSDFESAPFLFYIIIFIGAAVAIRVIHVIFLKAEWGGENAAEEDITVLFISGISGEWTDAGKTRWRHWLIGAITVVLISIPVEYLIASPIKAVLELVIAIVVAFYFYAYLYYAPRKRMEKEMKKGLDEEKANRAKIRVDRLLRKWKKAKGLNEEQARMEATRFVEKIAGKTSEGDEYFNKLADLSILENVFDDNSKSFTNEIVDKIEAAEIKEVESAVTNLMIKGKKLEDITEEDIARVIAEKPKGVKMKVEEKSKQSEAQRRDL
ncbi:MAG: hypothetical protein HZA00_10530 [Nitrospinae bacterium]|nr:hypothetical protein [Nitrospinota bacterium]